MNYRDAISKIGDKFARPGENWDANLLHGAPEFVDACEANRIADWLDSDADSEWGFDPRHSEIADAIRSLMDAGRGRVG